MIAYLLSLLTPGTEPEPHLSEVRRRIHRLQHTKAAPGEPTIKPPKPPKPGEPMGVWPAYSRHRDDC